MTSRRLAALALLALAGCPSKPAEPGPDAPSISKVKAGLAERERKVQTYRLSGTVTDLVRGDKQTFRFVFKGPNKMRGDLLAPANTTISFDGERLHQWKGSEGKLMHVDLSPLPRAQADQMLHAYFSPLAPEGFRTPLLPAGKDVSVKAEAGADGPLWHVQTQLKDGADSYAFDFRFAPKSMDFLGKDVTGPDGRATTLVTERFCDDKSGLCFPKVITEKKDDKPFAQVVLDAIEINPPVADDAFVIALPDGGVEESKVMAPASPGAASHP
jgi:hypothetical protein